MRGWLAAVAVLGGMGSAWAGVETVQYRGDPGDRGRGGYEQRGGYEERGGYEPRGGGGMPGGSYQRSCGQARVQGSILTAICRGERGRSFETSIDLARCGRSDIGNDGGTLQCAGNRGRSRRAD